MIVTVRMSFHEVGRVLIYSVEIFENLIKRGIRDCSQIPGILIQLPKCHESAWKEAQLIRFKLKR